MAITQVSNSLVKQDLTISGGTVDNTVIGSGTPAAGTFTTVAGTLASTVTGTTQAASDNSTKIATTAYVTTALANLVDSAPGTLNTLNELAAALGDDANFSTTVTNSIAAKAPLAGATFSGDISAPNIKATSEFQIFAGGTDIGAIFNSGGALTIQGTSTRDVSIGSDSNTNAIFIEGSDGNVGIGTTSPTFNTGSGLEIERAGAATLRLEDTGSSGKPFEIYSDDGEGYVVNGIGSGMPMIFKTVNAERMRINTSGYVGINQNSPAAKLDIKGDTTTFAGMAKIYLTDTSSNSERRNWSIGNGGSGFGHFTIAVSQAADGDPMATGTHTVPFQIDHTGNVSINPTGVAAASPLQHFQVLHHSGGGRRSTLYYNQDNKVALASLNASSTWENLAIEGANISLKTGGTTNTDAVVIDSDGKVAIGHSSPGGLPLQTKVSSGDNKFRQTTANKDGFTLGFENSTGNTIIGTHSKYPHTTFRDDGNVGIGSSGMPVQSQYAQLSIGAQGHFMAETTSGTGKSFHMSQNAHFDADSSWETMETDYASNYYQYAGSHNFRVASQTSAGTDITWIAALSIKNDGKVGIGQTGPLAHVHIKTSTNTPLLVESTSGGGGYIEYRLGASGAVLGYLGSAGELITGGSSSDLGIRSQGAINLATNGHNSRMTISSSGITMELPSGAGNADLRYNTGNEVVSYNTSSRLVKEDIEDIPYGLEAVKNLSPKKYKRTDGDKNVEIGFIADEVFEVVPELVGIMKKSVFTKEESDTEEIPGSVFYSQMSAVLVKAMQEAIAKIETLEAEVAALKGE